MLFCSRSLYHDAAKYALPTDYQQRQRLSNVLHLRYLVSRKQQGLSTSASFLVGSGSVKASPAKVKLMSVATASILRISIYSFIRFPSMG